MVDYFEDNQPFPSEENEALLELLTYELDEVYKELQEYVKNKMDEGKKSAWFFQHPMLNLIIIKKGNENDWTA